MDYSAGDEQEVYNKFVKGKDGLYILPYCGCIDANIFMHSGDIQVYADKSNKTDFFPDINDIIPELNADSTIFNVKVLELNMHGEPMKKEDMKWFFNGRLQPDLVRIVIQDCYHYNGEVIVSEPFKERYERLKEIISSKERIGLYEILPLPSEKVDRDIKPAEFQAIIDWVSDMSNINSKGAVLKPFTCTPFNNQQVVLDESK